jgi:hypothetical protein
MAPVAGTDAKMHSGRIVLRLTAVCLPLLMMHGQWSWAIQQAEDSGSWYLLARRAGRPEKNFYELTRKARFLEQGLLSEEMVRKYKPSPAHAGFDIETDGTVRYGVYQAWKVRVIRTSDSEKAPTSTKDGIYVLVYPRNPDWKFAAKGYKSVRTANVGRTLTYTDFQDGHECTVKLSPDWPRPWTIYEVEVLSSNAWVEIFRRQAAETNDGKAK